MTWTFRSLLAFLLLVFILMQGAVRAQDNLTWGVTALALKPPFTNAPSLEQLLSDDGPVASLNSFYLVGGEDRQATPTECRVAYDENALYVVFRCLENDLSFPARSQHANWYTLIESPSEQDSAFPDKVDLFIQPDMNSRSYFQFAATLNGLSFGYQHGTHGGAPELAQTGEDSATAKSTADSKVGAFTATVVKNTNGWVAFFSIPWKTLGGKPKDYFGLLPTRTRWRAGEVSSPVAMDFNERPPLDLFIETHFSGPPAPPAQTGLVQLPSGVFRWQRPALLAYPGPETLRQIWQMQQSLSMPTDTNNLSQRLYLTQRWMDLLTLEGFGFRATSGGTAPVDMTPSLPRRHLNDAFRRHDMTAACQALDTYLARLDKASRDWFADESPGDIADSEWRRVSEIQSVTADNNALVMHASGGGRNVDLLLSLPQSGGVRIHGDAEGYFKPDSLLPLNVVESSNSYVVETAEGKIVLNEKPFEISFYDLNGKPTLHLGPEAIGFRFDSAGKVIGIDFRGHLDTDETIYGFGERYDRFNEHGSIITLWGMDAWMSNIMGLMNQTYKPIPIFHSSKNYMVFDNSSYRLRADVGKTRSDELRITQQGPIFDCYFWVGPPEKAIKSYTELTGKPLLPPKWAFEPWMGRTGRGWNKPSGNQLVEEEKVVNEFAKLDIPHSALYAEGNAQSPELNTFMAARGIKVLSWAYPVIPEDAQAKLMPEKKRAELPVLRTEDPWQHVDFTNPNALELMRRWWKQRLDVGVAGSMVDFGDRVTESAVFYDGRRGDEMHNFYAYDYHRTYSEVFRERRGDDYILFARAAAPGTQKWIAQFGGDHPSNLRGLQSVLTGALNLSSCGFSTWGSDLGGFLGWPEPAVYMRWTQFGCFSPLMRCHGRTPREPWNYGDAAVANYKYFAWVRENLLDYIYDAAVEAHNTGRPMMRSMAVAYPNEPALAAVNDQYMFGADLLVAPVVDETNSRVVRFPSGTWTGLWGGRAVVGPADINVDVPLNSIPVYLRAGAAMPVQLSPSLAFGESMSKGRINALIMTPPQETETIPVSDGGHDLSVILQPMPGGFDLAVKGLAGTNYLLAYGVAASAVTVDGKVLTKLETGDPASMPQGWWVESNMNRTIIRLLTEQEGNDRKVEIKF